MVRVRVRVRVRYCLGGGPFVQLAALIDVIAAAHRSVGAFEPQALTLICFHTQCFPHHAPCSPHCVESELGFTLAF